MTASARDELGRIADAAAARFGGDDDATTASTNVVPADDLAIGTYVWSKAVVGYQLQTAKHGMVCDYGLDANDERPYVVVLAEDGPWRVDLRRWASSGKGERQCRSGALRRLYLDDIDATLTQPPDVLHIHAAARLACLTAGVGVGGVRHGMFSPDDLEMMFYAGTLLESAGDVLGAGR